MEAEVERGRWRDGRGWWHVDAPMTLLLLLLILRLLLLLLLLLVVVVVVVVMRWRRHRPGWRHRQGQGGQRRGSVPAVASSATGGVHACGIE